MYQTSRAALGLPLLEADPDLMAALRLPNGGVMLVFDPAKSAAPGRHVPSHGAEGLVMSHSAS